MNTKIKQFIKSAAKNPKQIFLCIYKTQKVAVPHLMEAFESTGEKLQTKMSVVDQCLRFPNGSYIYFTGSGGNPDRLRGLQLSGLYMTKDVSDETRFVASLGLLDIQS